jgi:transposase-like protein
MSNNVKGNQRRYTNDYKVEAIKLARQIKDNKKVATELGIPEGTLNTWVKKAGGTWRH